MSRQQQVANVDDDIVDETNQAIGNMVDDMKQINQMMGQAKTLAEAAQPQLDQAEENLGAAQQNLDAGTSELEEARALRRGCCGCCGVPGCFKPCACGENNDQCWCTIQ